MADVKLPGVGPVSKKWVVIVLGVSGVTVGYVVLRRKKTAAAASTAGAATTATGTIDPQTGDVAGSAQDQMDLAALQSGGYDSGAYGAGGYGTGSSLGNYGGYLAASPAGANIPGSGGFATNGEWAQQAESDLGNPPGLSNALGQYLTGRPLSPGDQGLTDQAIASENYPPVAGPDGYPPAMHTSATSTAPGTTAATGTTTTTTGTTATNTVAGHQISAPGGKTLPQIAAQYGVTMADLQRIDPGVVAKYGTTKVPAKGTGLYIPAH
jgi:LysM repeat protein